MRRDLRNPWFSLFDKARGGKVSLRSTIPVLQSLQANGLRRRSRFGAPAVLENDTLPDFCHAKKAFANPAPGCYRFHIMNFPEFISATAREEVSKKHGWQESEGSLQEEDQKDHPA